jgi:hypothetical protein
MVRSSVYGKRSRISRVRSESVWLFADQVDCWAESSDDEMFKSFG